MHQRNEAQVSHTSTLSHFLPRCQEDIKAQGYASESTSASLQLGATISRTLVRGGGGIGYGKCGRVMHGNGHGVLLGRYIMKS